MSENTKIEWTDMTWNPTSGCTWASPGCDNCYAAKMTKRLEAMGQDKYAGLTTRRHFNGIVKTDERSLTIPFRWRKPVRVFVNSMSDLFHKDVPFEFVDRVFAVMSIANQHTYQVLTKRPKRMAEYCERVTSEPHLIGVACGDLLDGDWIWGEGKRHREKIEQMINIWHGFDADEEAYGYPVNRAPWPLKNLCVGTSVENQESAEERIPYLVKCSAMSPVRFLFCEPMLGPVDLSRWLPCRCRLKGVSQGWAHAGAICPPDGIWKVCPYCKGYPYKSGIVEWVICGGESGHGARPMHPAWVRSLRDQCVSAGVPFFFKQWGEYEYILPRGICTFTDGSEVPPGAEPYQIVRVGKKKAGRLLDGKEWNQFPEVER